MKTRKQITLPSGGRCVVRKISQADYIASGHAPVFLQIGKQGRKPVAEPGEMSDAELMKMIEAMSGLTRVKLTRCCGTVTTADGTQLKIVDKSNVDDLAENEVSIDELDQADAEAICAAVDELSGFKKEAVQAAATFPAQQAGSGESAPVGNVLPRPADDAAGT